MENKNYKYNANEGIFFSDEELTLIKDSFNSLLCFPYERLNSNKNSLSYILPCVPYFMQGNDWGFLCKNEEYKFICSGVKIYIDKIFDKNIDTVKYVCTTYLSGIKYVDNVIVGFCTNGTYFYHINLYELVDKLLSVISEYQVFESEHRVEHIFI